MSVHKTLRLVAITGLVCMPAFAGLASAQAPAAVRTVATDPPVNIDEAMKAFRADLQTNRADVIAKNVTLTSEQAAKFWPVFSAYQKEQNVIMDEQLKGVQKYAEAYETLDDATALNLMNAHIQRDAQMSTLRQKWLAEFQKVLPTKHAVRVMQIDRRLSLVHQIGISAQIPLVY